MIYEVEKLNPVVKKHHISLVLLFGSRAKGIINPKATLIWEYYLNATLYLLTEAK